MLPLLLAACFLLLRLDVSDCSSSPASSSPAEEPREPAGGGAHGAAPCQQVPVDVEARAARAIMELSGYGGTGGAADDGDEAPSAAATPVRAEGVVAPRPPLWQKLARRLLAEAAGVEGAGTDGAGPSCHSNSVHINCPPGPGVEVLTSNNDDRPGRLGCL